MIKNPLDKIKETEDKAKKSLEQAEVGAQEKVGAFQNEVEKEYLIIEKVAQERKEQATAEASKKIEVLNEEKTKEIVEKVAEVEKKSAQNMDACVDYIVGEFIKN
ncbi:hypothetical protein KKC60_01270 [Patescibacteria group bacterium]|nr:hypothetical protein [Patescibacteria group bacterium]